MHHCRQERSASAPKIVAQLRESLELGTDTALSTAVASCTTTTVRADAAVQPARQRTHPTHLHQLTYIYPSLVRTAVEKLSASQC